MRIPSFVDPDHMVQHPCHVQLPSGKWVLARPEPFHSIVERWRLSWMVLTGKADVVKFKDQ